MLRDITEIVMSRKRLIYHPVAEFPLSDPEFAQAIQERFTRPDTPIQPTQPERRHLTILGVGEYPKIPYHLPGLCVHLSEQSERSLELNVVAARILGECALALVFNNHDPLREERWRINEAFVRAGATLCRHKKFKPHITIAKIPGGVSRRQVIRWTENMLPTDPTVIVGGITQDYLSGKQRKDATEPPLFKLVFGDENNTLVPHTEEYTPRRQPERKRHRRYAHRPRR